MKSKLFLGAGVILRDDTGHYHFVRRADGLGVGFPFGGVEPGETELQAAVRELREEIGAIVQPADVAEVYRARFEDVMAVTFAVRPGAYIEWEEPSHGHEGQHLIEHTLNAVLDSRNHFAAYNAEALRHYETWCHANGSV
jgi:8-oxo-dGTP pyrophosphatase MutT (NUDIX family)